MKEWLTEGGHQTSTCWTKVLSCFLHFVHVETQDFDVEKANGYSGT